MVAVLTTGNEELNVRSYSIAFIKSVIDTIIMVSLAFLCWAYLVGTMYCAVVILSMYDDAATRTRALAAGAAAFVGKHDGTEALLAAIRQAATQPPATGSEQEHPL